MNFSKVAQNDARSLKKIGCIFLHLGGGDQKPQMQNFRHFFYFSYFVSLPKEGHGYEGRSDGPDQ